MVVIGVGGCEELEKKKRTDHSDRVDCVENCIENCFIGFLGEGRFSYKFK